MATNVSTWVKRLQKGRGSDHLEGDLIAIPTAGYFDSLTGKINMKCVGLLNFFFLSYQRRKNWNTHCTKRFKQHIKYIFNFHVFLYFKLKCRSHYQAVGLSGRRTIDTHPFPGHFTTDIILRKKHSMETFIHP